MGKARIKIILVLFACFIVRSMLSQDIKEKQTRAYFIEPLIHCGFLATHYPQMNILVQGHFPAYEISIGKHTIGNEYWQHCLGYPRFGLSYWQSNLANKEMLGTAHALFPFMDFTLFRTKKFKQILRFGSGVGYLTKRYHAKHNNKNFAIGSHFNGAHNIHFKSKLYLTGRLDIASSFGITHFSNSSVEQPNLGINNATINISASYKFGKKRQIIDHLPEPAINKKIDFLASGGVGYKEIPGDDLYPNHYFVYYASFEANRFIGHISQLNAGLDVFYDNSDFFLLDMDSIEYNNRLEIIQPGIHFGHNLCFSDLAIGFSVGTYLYSKEKSDGIIYNTLNLRYFLKNNIFVTTAFKSHFAKAEFLSFAVGYKF